MDFLYKRNCYVSGVTVIRNVTGGGYLYPPVTHPVTLHHITQFKKMEEKHER
jgi:hypothetical protein